MVTVEEVAAVCSSFPEVTVGERYGNRTWTVGKASFAWQRPLTKADVKRFGDARIPEGPIVAVATEDMADKAAVLAANHRGVFDMEHFQGYPAVLVELDRAAPGVLRELLLDGYLAAAPPALAEQALAAARSRRR